MWESRVAPLTGVLFGVLLLASYLIDPNTDFMPPANEVVSHLEDGPLRVMAGAYMRMLAAAGLVWFGGSLHKSLKRLGGDRLALLSFGGGVMAASLIAVGSIATVSAAERVLINETIDPGAAAALSDIAGIATGNGAPIGFAILIGAAGIAMLGSPRQRAWVGWTSVAIALGLLSPYGWMILAAVLIWVPAAGLWIYRADSRQTELAGVR